MNDKKIKNFIITLINLFVPSKKLRKKVRDKFYNRNIIKTLNHDIFGKIYVPMYNLDYDISSVEPEVYNKNGQAMRTFFLRDLVLAHDPNSKSKYFQWDRYNFGLKNHFYSHQSMLELMGKPDKRYGLLHESEAIVPEDYKIFDKHKGLEKDFDLIFTYSADLLEKLNNARFVPFASEPWYGTEYSGGILKSDAYKDKVKDVSFCSSKKATCDLHKFRVELAKKCEREKLADTMGNFNGGSIVGKYADVVSPYRFNIAIENDVTPYYFSERLTSCFAAMTIPVYLGATKIDEFFNPDGIIKISIKDFDNIENILKQCTKEEYERRLPAVIDNFNRVQQYLNVWDKMYEDYLINA